MLQMLGGKEYFVKAWLDQEQLYLLCNVDGFVVSYLTLGQRELRSLFDKVAEQAREEKARAEKVAEAERRSEEQDDGESSPRSPRTPRGVQASWLSRLLLRGTEKSDLEYSPALLRENARSEIEICSLGDADIIGLESESMEYAEDSLKKQLRELPAESSSSRKVSKQAKRLSRLRAMMSTTAPVAPTSTGTSLSE